MNQPLRTPSIVRFGPFKLDPQAGELHTDGRKIRLQDKPLQILLMLLERPGEVVTREELQRKLWSADTFVDFEASLNTAVKKLRDALDDSAEEPRFVETIPRRGYRFIYRVDHNGSGESAHVPGTLPTHATLRPALMYWAMVAVIGLIGTGIWSGWTSWRTTPKLATPIRFALNVPSPTYPQMFWDSPKVAFSPDSSLVAYVQPDRNALYVRPMDKLEGEPLPGGADATAPFFSPDARSIGFFTASKLMRLSVRGGVPTPLCSSYFWIGASWGPDDTIIFAPGWNTPILRVPAAGGTPHPITKLDTARGENSHRWPTFLPDGKAILFTIKTLKTATFDEAEIAVQPLDGGPHRVVIQGGSAPVYVPGYIIFARAHSLLAMPFNLEKLEATGSAFTVLEGVSWNPFTGAAQYAVSRNGSLVYIASNAEGRDRRLVWVDRSGTVAPIPIPPQSYRTINVSPDGQSVAAGITAANDDIWIADLVRGKLTRLTAHTGSNNFPVWTSDGKRVLFLADRGGVWWKAADGTGDDTQLSALAGTPESVSPDGRFLVYTSLDPQANMNGDVWIMPLRPNATPQPLLRTSFNELEGVISPDGKWISYTSNTTGEYEVYVRAFPGPGPAVRVSTGGGFAARWAHNGRELFYRNVKKMMAVRYSLSPGFKPEQPQVLFEGDFLESRNYGVTQDDQRFIMVELAQADAAPRQMVIVVNWLEEFKLRTLKK